MTVEVYILLTKMLYETYVFGQNVLNIQKKSKFYNWQKKCCFLVLKLKCECELRELCLIFGLLHL